jgi:hypothetical protein
VVVGAAAAAAAARQVGQRVCLAAQLAHLSNVLFSKQSRETSVVDPSIWAGQQGCGSESAWISINLSCWIRIQEDKNDPEI